MSELASEPASTVSGQRVALVTGAAKGIGRAIAAAFAESGANVMITSRRADALTSVAGELEEAGDLPALARLCRALLAASESWQAEPLPAYPAFR